MYFHIMSILRCSLLFQKNEKDEKIIQLEQLIFEKREKIIHLDQLINAQKQVIESLKVQFPH